MLNELSTQLADAVDAVAASVVQVQGRRRPASGLVYADGMVLTTMRAIGADDGLRVRRHDGTVLGAELAGWDPTTSLAVLRVATGQPPTVMTEPIVGPGIQGAVSGDQVVVFSTQPLGRPASLPFSYQIKGSAKHQHTLVNMAGSCDVKISRERGAVTVVVSAGSRHRANDHSPRPA